MAFAGAGMPNSASMAASESPFYRYSCLAAVDRAQKLSQVAACALSNSSSMRSTFADVSLSRSIASQLAIDARSARSFSWLPRRHRLPRSRRWSRGRGCRSRNGMGHGVRGARTVSASKRSAVRKRGQTPARTECPLVHVRDRAASTGTAHRRPSCPNQAGGADHSLPRRDGERATPSAIAVLAWPSPRRRTGMTRNCA